MFCIEIRHTYGPCRKNVISNAGWGESSHECLELAEELSGDEASEAPADFPWALAFASAPLEVGAGCGVCEAAGPGDDVQCSVKLPVTVAVETMSARVAGGCRDGICAGEGGEGGFGRDPAVVRVGGEDDRGGHRAHPDGPQ